MKNIVLLLCLAFIAFSFPAASQSHPEKASPDTLQIQLKDRNQVFIIGSSLKNMADYKRADSLKTFFFADLKKAQTSQAFQEVPQRIYYFVNKQGKRRLKAELNEDMESKFDLAAEKKRMLLDLPPLHYTIYDLPQNLEINYYLEDTSAIQLATNTSLNAAIQELKKDRNKLSGLSAYHLEKNGFGFEKKNTPKRKALYLEAFANGGALLLGSQPSPVIGYDFFLTLPNLPSNSTNNFRLGFSYNTFVLTDFADGQFKSINPGTFWKGILQSNLGQNKDDWFGISAGQISNRDANGLPGKPFIFGIMTNYNSNSFSFDIVYLDKKKFFKTEQKRQLFMLTYRRSFF